MLLRSKLTARESGEGNKTSENRRLPGNNNNSKPHTLSGASALLTKSSGESKIRCAYCNGLHYSASCDVMPNCEGRKEIIAKAGQCYNCLRKGHQVKECTSQSWSNRHCNKRHHQSIFNKSDQKVVEEPQKEEPKPNTSSNFTANNVKQDGKGNTDCAFANRKSCCL